MRTRLAIATAALLAAFGGVSVAAAAEPYAQAAHCSPGWKYAVIGGEAKCLRAGQFCARRHDAQYRKHGYRCTKYDPKTKRYRLTR